MSKDKIKLFLLEDDTALNETVCDFFTSKGYAIQSAFDGFEAQDMLYEKRFDLILLDVNTPGINGFEVLKEVRKNGIQTPAIYITSLNSVDDLEKGFDSGCDDYIRKPFALKELLIRVETLLKREFFHEVKDNINLAPNIEYNVVNNELIVDGKNVNIGNKESKLLKLFMQHKGEIISHESIYDYLWEYDEEPSDTALRTYIKNLRKVIGKDSIESIKKQGYKFTLKK
ncbi:MAG: response regulator transcription factor [Campylobacterales bacterium]|nr:response regulator transcription factor [Campylobacterales bacterium]